MLQCSLSQTVMILTESLPSLSGRILLVPPSDADDAPFAALRGHPETRRFIPFAPAHTTPDEARERRLARESNKAVIDFSIYAVTPGSPPKYVGAVGLLNIDEAFRSADSGLTVVPDSFRTGIATDALHAVFQYAFEERKLHRVVLHTGSQNFRMRGWLDRFGATLEGTLRDVWADGEGGYMDGCIYSILEYEWPTVKAKLEERINQVTG
ncbi:acyl-CoA N-acyltransferase [Mycena olivaceomarginata]|nr:acyl-CoA N-acyltransferase [Mycena olivaceomarginata]